MEDNQTNNKKLSLLFLFIFILSLSGLTYAGFIYDGISLDNVITTGNISMSFIEPSNAYILDNAMPMNDDVAIATGHGFEFQIISNATTNTNDLEGIEIPYEINIEIVDVDTNYVAIPNDKVKVYLVDQGSGEVVLEPTLISNLEGSSLREGSKVLFNSINLHNQGRGETVKNYKLLAWIDKNYEIVDSDTSKYQYKFRININYGVSAGGSSPDGPVDVIDNEDPVLTLTAKDFTININATDNVGVVAYAISNNLTDTPQWVDISSTLNFVKSTQVDNYGNYYVYVKDAKGNTVNSMVKVKSPIPTDNYENGMLGYAVLGNNKENVTTGDVGLLKSIDTNYPSEAEHYPTYYFKGVVINNYVKFGKVGNDDLLWRIVRLNEDGTIRIVLQTPLNRQKFNDNFNAAKYMYFRESSTTGIMGTLNNWYDAEFIADKTKVATSSFCEQAKVVFDSNWAFEGSDTMISKNDYTSNFKCNATGLISDQNIGLLSIDEVMMSGILLKSGTNSSYLYTNDSFWTMSPAGFKDRARVWVIGTSGIAKNTGVSSTGYASRPVINLKANVEVISGNGEEGSPYQI